MRATRSKQRVLVGPTGRRIPCGSRGATDSPYRSAEHGGWQSRQTIAVENPADRGTHVLGGHRHEWVNRLVGQRELPAVDRSRRAAAELDANRRHRASIPGLIEAEKFDEGGEGIATAIDDGRRGDGFVRPDSTSRRRRMAAAATALGYVGWRMAEVFRFGNHDRDLCARSTGRVGRTRGAFHVEVDGVDATGPMVVPPTGGWQKWQTISLEELCHRRTARAADRHRHERNQPGGGAT